MSELTERAERLAQMAESLPSLEEIRGMPVTGEVIEYECECGSCTGFYMYKRDGLGGWAAQRARMEAGTRLKRHRQDEMEVLIVVYGRISVERGEGDCAVELGPGQSQMFVAGQPHSVTALENTELVGITIPSSPGYPSRDG